MAKEHQSRGVQTMPHRKLKSAGKLRCLLCGDLLSDTKPMAGRFPTGDRKLGEADDRHPLPLRCAGCDADNHLIKEYAFGGIHWRLSHGVRGATVVVDDGECA